MSKKISKDWDDWIILNIERGCDLDELKSILLSEGFSASQVEVALERNSNLKSKFLSSFKLKLSSFFLKKRVQKKIALNNNFKNAIQVNTQDAEIYTVDSFLNKAECKELINIIKHRLRPSAIASSGGTEDTNFRTSKTCDLAKEKNVLVKDIDKRICNYLGIDSSLSEGIQGQYYELGNEFKAHTDFFEGPQKKQYTAKQGQRTYTFMIYLNDVEEGGETEFLEINKTFKPKVGQALFWNNLKPDGSVNHNTLHQAHPVVKSNKAVITKWFREG